MRAMNSDHVIGILGRNVTSDELVTYLDAVELCDRYMNARGRMFMMADHHLPKLCATNGRERPAVENFVRQYSSVNPLLGGTKLDSQKVDRKNLVAAMAGVRVGFEKRPLAFATRDRLLIAASVIVEYARLRQLGVGQSVIHGNLGVQVN